MSDANGDLNAFVHLDAERALATAETVDRAVVAGHCHELGPLAGVPFGVKDLEDCSGMPTTRGSRWFANAPSKTVDAIHGARLRAAGAVPIGKTAAPEIGAWADTASPLWGVTRNPWDTSRTPGGSSGGSSAAVSSGMVPFCTASDAGPEPVPALLRRQCHRTVAMACRTRSGVSIWGMCPVAGSTSKRAPSMAAA